MTADPCEVYRAVFAAWATVDAPDVYASAPGLLASTLEALVRAADATALRVPPAQAEALAAATAAPEPLVGVGSPAARVTVALADALATVIDLPRAADPDDLRGLLAALATKWLAQVPAAEARLLAGDGKAPW